MNIELVESQTAAESVDVGALYDALAEQRFEFEVTEGGAKYDTAHVFKSLSDERFLEYLRGIKVRGSAENMESDEAEAVSALWKDLIVEVENVELEPGTELVDAIGFQEKSDAIQTYLAVAAFDPENKATGARRLGPRRKVVVITEARMNGEILQQQHEMRAKSIEDIKKYESILRRRFRTEQTRGLRRSPKFEFVPQDEKLGKLYDDMLIETSGFEGGRVPLRFKTAVLYHLFSSDLDEKKS